MSIQFDEKGKFYTDVVPKISVRCVIQTANQAVRGKLHVREGERLKDELDRDELFLAVTDASILSADGTEQYHAPFLAIQRSQVIWVYPDEPEQKA